MSAALAFVSAALAVLGMGSLVPATRSSREGGRLLAIALSVGRRLRPAAVAPGELEARIAAAGAPGGLGVREAMGLKVAAALGGGLLGVPVATVLPGRLGIAAVIASPVAGFMAPDLWLNRRARQRARRIRRELPAMLDLLRVTVESGLSLGAALGEVGERTRGPLARDWRAVGRETALGVPLTRALDSLVRRAPLPEIEALAAAIKRAARHGAPLAATLDAQARDARSARRRRIQEEAARAAPKIQLVVALLLVPSVLLLVAAALAAALLNGSGSPV
ncbi:MAG TPA: type II secretion system F family protein [Thermoleophilaceae bacterium]